MKSMKKPLVNALAATLLMAGTISAASAQTTPMQSSTNSSSTGATVNMAANGAWHIGVQLMDQVQPTVQKQELHQVQDQMAHPMDLHDRR
ncbi:MAG: hypothetical protein ABI415_05200 [Flavitalea sp.]